MADEWRVGGPDRRSSTDVDHAIGIAGNHVCRLLARAYRDDGAVLVSKSRDGAIGSGPEQDDLALSLFDSIPGGKTSCFHGSLLGFYERFSSRA